MKSRDIQHKLNNRKIIITAGGTIEPIDLVRYIGNFSSGKMGIAMAREFCKYTKNVLLIYGHIKIPLPNNIPSIHALTVKDMYQAIKKNMTSNSILVMAAAVSDFKVKMVQAMKIKKTKSLTLKLVPTIDILKELSKQKKARNIFVGFAAETNHLIPHARKKLKEKKLDLIVANPINKKNYPFGADDNKVFLIDSQRVYEFPKTKKTNIAKKLVQFIMNMI